MGAKDNSRFGLLRWLCLAPIPVLWCVIAHYGWLEFLETKSLDWRFQYRGEISAPIKVNYVDIDSTSIDEVGGWPWSRANFQKVTKALIVQGGVKAIGIDIVLSDLGMAEVADRTKIKEGNKALANFLWGGSFSAPKPPVVLASSFTAENYRDVRGITAKRRLPLVEGDDRKLEDIEPPELPSFDIGKRVPFNPPHVAIIDTLNGETRWVPLFAPTNLQTYRHMSLELARLYLGVSRDAVQVSDDEILLKADDGKVLASIPLFKKQHLEINWHSAWISPLNPRLSFSTVLNHVEMLNSTDPDEAKRAQEQKIAQEFFAQSDWKDSIVLIGPTDRLMQDLGSAPFDKGPVPKVGVHGNLVKTILSGNYLHRLPSWHGFALLDFAIILILTPLIATLAVTGGARGVLWKLAAVGLVAVYVGVSFELFRFFHVILPLSAPLGAAFSTSFGAVIWQVVLEEKQKGRIKGMFGTYLSPTVVQGLIESGKDPELGGHDAEITPYFSDIQSFSSFSEVMSAQKLGELLNEYLSACTDIVQAEGGTLDKFIGDAVVAMYGAPVEVSDHALRACIASQHVHRKLAEMRDKWKSEGDKWPPLVFKLQTRIGLNTGVCMIGNMGSQTRFNYTMMGDNVNLAARMESGAKSWGVYTMCTETTKAAAELHGPGQIVFRSLGRIVVKGRSQAVPIHEITGLRADLSDRTLECVGLFDQAMARMYARDWDAALALFRRSAELEPNQPGVTPGVKLNASLVRIEKVEALKLDPPPEGWDGIEVMTEK